MQSGLKTLSEVFTLNFSLSTLLLAGATLQAILLTITKSHISILLTPALALLFKFTLATLQSTVLPNPYLAKVIPGRVTALPPSNTGNPSPSSRKIAILHLGAKSNHPYGFFQPQLTRMNVWLEKMNQEFNENKHTGFLGQTMFTRKDERGAVELINISYWDGVEALWEFAHSGTHREAWMWWEKHLKENGAIGINHEIYEAPEGGWENVYLNFQPTLQGATTYLRKGNELVGGNVGEEWVRPLVDARKGVLAKSSGRFGRGETKFDAGRVGRGLYVD